MIDYQAKNDSGHFLPSCCRAVKTHEADKLLSCQMFISQNLLSIDSDIAACHELVRVFVSNQMGEFHEAKIIFR